MLPQILLSQRPHIVAVGSNFACYNFIRGAFLLFTEAGEILSAIYNRLNGLALLNVHHDIPVDADEVIDDFARHRKRKLEFVL